MQVCLPVRGVQRGGSHGERSVRLRQMVEHMKETVSGQGFEDRNKTESRVTELRVQKDWETCKGPMGVTK